jgi:glycosyltransferase involved in cell wall biosynthesis
LHIAQVAPLTESVPPRGYGGTERIVSYLTEELVKLGHDVTLFASADSVTKAKLQAVCPRSLRLDTEIIDKLAAHYLMVEQVFQNDDFDIIHSHIDYLPFSLIRRHHIPSVSTVHGRLDLPDLVPIFTEFKEMPLVSISDAQRQPLSWANWQGTIYHGLPNDLYSLNEKADDYLIYIGRMSEEKRVIDAIDIAKKSNRQLIIGGKVDPTEVEYFESAIKPLLDHPLIEFVGEISEQRKEDLLSNASAFLFPIDWPEPFGLVMIEAMACGTPVIARVRGSVREVIDPGVTGFLINSVDEAVQAVRKLPTLSRRRCRDMFETRFTARIMTENYLRTYQKIIATQKGRLTPWVK